MKQFSYEELLAESEKRKKEKLNILGKCCNCSKIIRRNQVHTTTFNAGFDEAYCCENCENFELEVRVFCYLLSCVLNKRTWESLRDKFKDLQR